MRVRGLDALGPTCSGETSLVQLLSRFISVDQLCVAKDMGGTYWPL